MLHSKKQNFVLHKIYQHLDWEEETPEIKKAKEKIEELQKTGTSPEASEIISAYKENTKPYDDGLKLDINKFIELIK